MECLILLLLLLLLVRPILLVQHVLVVLDLARPLTPVTYPRVTFICIHLACQLCIVKSLIIGTATRDLHCIHLVY